MLEKIKDAPWRWLVISLILYFIGLLALYSIAVNSDKQLLSSRFARQIVWLIPCLFSFSLFLLIPKRLVYKYAYLAAILCTLLLFIPFFMKPVAGTYRWISFGVMSFQPSEILKWLLVLTMARFLSDHNLEVKNFRTIILPVCIVLLPAGIISQQPDLGTAIIMVAPLIPLLYWVGFRLLHIILLVAPVFSIITAFNYYTFTFWIIFIALYLHFSKTSFKVGFSNVFGNIFIGLLTPFLWNKLAPYQQNRILVLIDSSKDPFGVGYQIIQSQTAIGSGGFWGKGFGEGSQTHLKFLPEQETDFILSVIGEEFGFVGVCFVLILFSMLILNIIKISFQSNERFSSLVLIGIASILIAQVFVNVAMTINLLPVKGLPLPFMSYGGSFLLSCFSMLGLAMNMKVELRE